MPVAISIGARTFVAVGSDLGLFRAGRQALGDRFKEPAATVLRAGLR
jgi:hypothetical protein